MHPVERARTASQRILSTALSIPAPGACRTGVGSIGGPEPGGNEMAQYLILIYEDESQYATASPQVFDEIMQAHNAFAGQVEEHGAKLLGGNALQSTGTATSIRGGSEVTDGPFVETKEVLGGYYLVDAPDLDAALAVGKLCPARFGGVEVRPVMTFE
jgi:hypothetical protein